MEGTLQLLNRMGGGGVVQKGFIEQLLVVAAIED
jgi:hypothetical protein